MVEMNILLCNDDGFEAKGIRKLAVELSKNHNVRIVAPKQNCSGFSQSLTFRRAVKVEKQEMPDGIETYSVSGTPADCVKIAHHIMEDFSIDLVISGINDGYNLGSDVYYSGTVGIALQGAVLNYPSIAFSAPPKTEHLDFYVRQCERIIQKLIKLPFAAWNVNFPPVDPKDIKGLRFTKVGVIHYTDTYLIDKNEYTLVGDIITDKYNEDDADVEQCKAGYITVSPISRCRTDFEVLTEVLSQNK